MTKVFVEMTVHFDPGLYNQAISILNLHPDPISLASYWSLEVQSHVCKFNSVVSKLMVIVPSLYMCFKVNNRFSKLVWLSSYANFYDVFSSEHMINQLRRRKFSFVIAHAFSSIINITACFSIAYFTFLRRNRIRSISLNFYRFQIFTKFVTRLETDEV